MAVRKCDSEMLTFLEEQGVDCSIDAFCAKHRELYSKVKNMAIDGKIKEKLILLDRPVLLNYVFSEINMNVPIKDGDLGVSFKNELSDETIDVLIDHMKRMRNKTPSRELLSHLIGGDFEANRHMYDRAIAKLKIGAGQTAITAATHFGFDVDGGYDENGRRFRVHPDDRWLELVLATLEPKFKRVIPHGLLNHLAQLLAVPQPGGSIIYESLGIKTLQRLLDAGFVPEKLDDARRYRNGWMIRIGGFANPEALIDPKKKDWDFIIYEFEQVVRRAGPFTKKWLRQYKQQIRRHAVESSDAKRQRIA